MPIIFWVVFEGPKMDYQFSKKEKKEFLEEFLRDDTSTFYNIYKTKKKSGAMRTISAPCSILKEIQREAAVLLEDYWNDELSSASWVTGFSQGKSILDNAKPHLGSEWIINLDISDFFPSIPMEKTLEVLAKIPVHTGFRAWLNDLKNKTDFYELSIDQLYKVVTLRDKLPQGSPASPIISNIAGFDIDTVVQSVIKAEWNFTRYADDITLSTKTSFDRPWVEELTNTIIKMIETKTPYKIKDKKVNIKHRSQRQLVTGVVVNNKQMGVSRQMRNIIRAILHQHKLQDKKLDDSILGVLNFIKQVNNEQYEKLTKDFPCNLRT